MTTEEKILWEALRHSKIGAKFRRQHKLVIEVDGKIHLKPEIKANDAEREHELKELGLTIIRFTNEEVNYQLEQVLEEIKAKITK